LDERMLTKHLDGGVDLGAFVEVLMNQRLQLSQLGPAYVLSAPFAFAWLR
jgi:hypothetical protein